MLIIVVSIISLVLAWFFLKPYIRNKSHRKILLRLYLLLVPLSIIAYWIANYFIYYNIPESFERGVELLQKNKDIQSKIGTYESYTYFNNDLPKEADNPASFKVSLKGNLATIYLSCKITKDKVGAWRFVEIKQDSLKKSNN